MLPARDQGSQGSCYAQSAACAKEWQEKQDYGFEGYMSPQFIYNNRENSSVQGMTGRDVMKILFKVGVVAEEKYPYKTIEKKDEINKELYNLAHNHVIKGYASIDDIDTLKRALVVNGPCLIGVPTYNYGTRMWKKEKNEILLGGHAMTIIG